MKRIILITLMTSFGVFQSCQDKEAVLEVKTKVLSVFEKDLAESISNRNNNGSSISNELVLDTVFIKQIPSREDYVVLAEYHTSDEKLDIAILGISSETNDIPTFSLIDQTSRSYILESINVQNDSLILVCDMKYNEKHEPIKISYDLSFDKTSFPWSIN